MEYALTDLEVRSLNRVGLYPQKLPSNLDDYIRLYLWEKAEIDILPAGSSTMVGGKTAAFATGFTSVLVQEGGASMGTSLTVGSIKQQTNVQEWIHWKKHALDKPDFEEYRTEKKVRYDIKLGTMVTYIRSKKGQACCVYEKNRGKTRTQIGVATYCTFGLAYLVVSILKILDGNDKDTLIEWLIQKKFKMESFSSVVPQITVSKLDELILDY